MLKEIGAALQWYAMLGARFFRVFPVGTVSAITLTFLAQLALIASLLLPLKIVMIMSSGNIPNVLPSAFDHVNENILISALAAIAIGAFLFNSIATKTIENLAGKGASKVQQHADKLALFENQDNLAQTALLKFTATIASLLFVIAGLAILTWLYWELAAVAAIYVAVCLGIYSGIWAKAPSQWTTISSQLGKHLGTLSNVGFLALFLTIVIDYMVDTIPGFLAVLLSIILSRQLFSQMAAGINSIYFLNTHQPKIKAITFENHAFANTYHGKQGSVWGYLTDDADQQELIEYVCKLSGAKPSETRISWMDTGLQNILHFIVEVRSPDQKYLVRVFDKNKTAKARHEATLLLAPPENLPSPELLRAATTKKQFHIHIFDISGCTPLPTSRKKSALSELDQTLSQITPSSELIEQHQRSRLMIWDRIDKKLIERITASSTEDGKDLKKEALALLPTWKEELKALPLAIRNPRNKSNLLLMCSNEDIISTYWGEWSIEPCNRATDDNDRATSQLLALCHNLEQATTNQKYSEASKILHRMLQS
ncbi:hypothetical protein ACJO2E_12500 [Marinobacter sp. M1N3S26]|uniref:hypothetical protein n=1 Tax=Marinobacter sp. M1N3S26 TaxID=3382299 RepID=UPI00387ABB07